MLSLLLYKVICNGYSLMSLSFRLPHVSFLILFLASEWREAFRCAIPQLAKDMQLLYHLRLIASHYHPPWLHYPLQTWASESTRGGGGVSRVRLNEHDKAAKSKRTWVDKRAAEMKTNSERESNKRVARMCSKHIRTYKYNLHIYTHTYRCYDLWEKERREMDKNERDGQKRWERERGDE